MNALQWLINRSNCSGYLVVISEDITTKEKLVQQVKNEASDIEVLSEYSLMKSRDEIICKLAKHSVLLDKLEEHLREADSYEQDKALSVYGDLIRYREATRYHPLIIICNSEIAEYIYGVYGYNCNLNSWAKMRLDLR